MALSCTNTCTGYVILWSHQLSTFFALNLQQVVYDRGGGWGGSCPLPTPVLVRGPGFIPQEVYCTKKF